MSEKKNRLAVSATEKVALENNWFFREQTISDQGIDAHVEKFELVPGKAGDDEIGTGRLLALQIKGGPSYFTRTSPRGWWFRFDERKRALWLNHALPVVVVLVDLESNELYWQRVTPATVQQAGNSFKLEVPRTQTISTSDAEWTEIASGLESQALGQIDYSLTGVAPAVKRLLTGRSPAETADAALLAMHLARGRNNPNGTIQTLLTAAPGWITRNSEWGWAALAAYASSHEINDAAAQASLLAADAAQDDDTRSRHLVVAALHLVERDFTRAERVFDVAAKLPAPNEIFVAAANTMLSVPPGRADPWTLAPRLEAGGNDIDESPLAQRVLARHAYRRRDLDNAIVFAKAAHRIDPSDSATAKELAQYLVARWNTEGTSTGDLTDAIALLEEVISSCKPWSGPVSDARTGLVTAYALAGRWESLIRSALPPPHGILEEAEVEAGLARSAAFAAWMLGRIDARDSACAFLSSSDSRDILMQAQVGYTQLPATELSALRSRALDEAIRDQRYEDIARYALTVAASGLDTSTRLQPFVDRGIIPTQVQQLASVLRRAKKDLDGTLPQLRDLARTDPVAGQHLISLLQSAGRHVDAADEAEALYQTSGSEGYLLDRANCLIDAGGGADAVQAAKEAVAKTTLRPVERGRMLTYLGGAAADEGDWPAAELYLSRVLDLFDRPTDSAVWQVIACIVNQGRTNRAARLFAQYRPEVRDLDEARLWLRAHSTLRWTTRIAFEAYALAERFEDPTLSTALLGHIVFNTHGVEGETTRAERGSSAGNDGEDVEELDDEELEERRRLAQHAVPGELHRRAFALMERLVELHGAATGITVMKGEPSQLMEQMTETLKRTSAAEQALSDLVPMVRESRLPMAFVAGAFHRGYAATVLQRALGVLVASSPDDDENDTEVRAAADRLGGSVVIDAAALLTLTGLSESAEFTGEFIALLTPPAVLRGIHRAGFEIRGLAGSPGALHWDSERGSIAVNELPDDQFRRLLRRSDALEAYSDRLQVGVPTRRLLAEELGLGPAHDEWLDVLELAREKGLSVWSDDLGLRRFARASGLTAFGTPALVEALRNRQLDAARSPSDDDTAIGAAHARLLEMASDFVVDLPLTGADILELAEADEWRPLAAAAAIARPAWWQSNPDGFETLRRVYHAAPPMADEWRAGWQLAAMYGAARSLIPEAASSVLAMIALAGFADNDSDESRLEGLKRARKVALDVQAPDPIGSIQMAALEVQRKGMSTDDPTELAGRLLRGLENDITVAAGPSQSGGQSS